uniref:Putative glycoprotein hormone-alpha2 n=1 Tax=Trichinella spiralis TaxID=6334 RepID=C6SUP5_TRISP|nr:TPA: putative glycoprotein hormone-alpha2 [Trichinella spiralis]
MKTKTIIKGNFISFLFPYFVVLCFLFQFPIDMVRKKNGCSSTAVEKLITIPGCIPVRVQLNACRGYCLSWTVPDGRRTVASYAMCCRMVERELVEFETRCQESKREKFSFTSAVSCECFDCIFDLFA